MLSEGDPTDPKGTRRPKEDQYSSRERFPTFVTGGGSKIRKIQRLIDFRKGSVQMLIRTLGAAKQCKP